MYAIRSYYANQTYGTRQREVSRVAEKTEQIENRDQARVWAAKHAPSIEDKRVKWLRKWDEKSDAEKAEYTLRKEDGR